LTQDFRLGEWGGGNFRAIKLLNTWPYVRIWPALGKPA